MTNALDNDFYTNSFYALDWRVKTYEPNGQSTKSPTDSGYLEKLFLSPIRLHILPDKEAQWGGVGDSSEPFIPLLHHSPAE